MIKLTLFTKAQGHGALSKEINLIDGEPVSDGSGCRMSKGLASPIEVSDLAEFNERVIGQMDSRQALALGQLTATAMKHIEAANGSLPVVSKREFDKPFVDHAVGTITRSMDFLQFVPGESGLLLLDIDLKGAPTDLIQRIDDLGGAWAMLCSVVPELSQVAHAIRASTSAGLINTESGASYPTSRGQHIYIPVSDSADIPRALEVIFYRLWIAGFGWIFISKSGSQLPRTIIDASVGSPERLVFEGPPVLGKGLSQDPEARRLRISEGNTLDTRAVLQSIDGSERIIYDGLVAAAKAGTAAEARRVRDTADEKTARSLVAASGGRLTPTAALAQARDRHNGRIGPDVILHFDSKALGSVSAADVLANLGKYVGASMRDPLEPDYGPQKAMLLRSNPNEPPIIHSFAHGSHVLKFSPSEATIMAAVAAAAPGEVISIVIEMLAEAGLADDGVERVMQAAAQRANVGIRSVRKRMREFNQHKAAIAREQLDAQRRESDQRVRIDAPSPKAEVLAFIRPIDRLLAAASRREAKPPMRDALGRLATVEMQSQKSMHTLGLRDENGKSLPAPPQPTIRPLTALGVAMLVEKYVRCVSWTRDGYETSVAVPDKFCAALNELQNSDVSKLSGVQTLPLVLTDGSIRSGQHFDPETGILFDVPQVLQDCVPADGKTPLAVAKKAYESLCNAWLCDVATDVEGRAVTVAMALTLISRLVLEEKPGFVVRAGQVANGKSTLINMVSAGVLGTRAAASPWPNDENERRKGLLSYLISGAALVVYDNVERGSSIASPAIEAAMTTGVLSDRILGSSTIVSAPMSTVLVWTGNAITQSRDIATRTFDITLRADRSDPENRQFKHSDIIGWTLENRTEILSNLYAVLTCEVPDTALPTSRFKNWQLLIGRRVEAVSGVSFDEMMRKKIAEAPESGGLGLLLHLLHEPFGEDEFKAALVTEKIKPYNEQAAELHEALINACGGRDFDGQPTPRSVGKRLAAQVDAVADYGNRSYVLRAAKTRTGVTSFQIEFLQDKNSEKYIIKHDLNEEQIECGRDAFGRKQIKATDSDGMPTILTVSRMGRLIAPDALDIEPEERRNAIVGALARLSGCSPFAKADIDEWLEMHGLMVIQDIKISHLEEAIKLLSRLNGGNHSEDQEAF